MQSLTALQNQIDSLATVTLQNQRGLDLLTDEKKGLSLFLGGKKYGFYGNQPGGVTDAAWKLADHASKIPQKLSESQRPFSGIWY